MTGEVEDEQPVARRSRSGWRRVRRLAITLAVLLLVALVALWLARKPIADNFIAAELQKRGVSARYRIADLGFSRQRLTDVAIGDPRAPDLTADWIEVRTSLWGGPRVTGIRAGQVRMHGRLINGRLALGEIDKLLPAPSGGPITLPEISLDVADARMRLATPQGPVGLKLSGSGKLSDGFNGQVAAVAERLRIGDCAALGAEVVSAVHVARGSPRLKGPARLARLVCPQARMDGAAFDLDATLNKAFDQWNGNAKGVVGTVRTADARVDGISATLSFGGGMARTAGRAVVNARHLAVPGLEGSGAGVNLTWLLRGSDVIVDGAANGGNGAGDGMTLAPSQLAALTRLRGTGQGTPVGPLVTRLIGAAQAASRAFSFDARLRGQLANGKGVVTLSQLAFASRSGVRGTLGQADIRYRWPENGLKLGGRLDVSGGGMPSLHVQLAQAAPGKPVTGTATLRGSYEAGSARLTLAPVTFSVAPGGMTRVTTRMLLSGPLADGQVDRLFLPINARWDGEALIVDPGCVVAGFERLWISSLRLGALHTRLCPVVGPALVSLRRGQLSGGARIAPLRLAGMLGSSPIRLDAGSAQYRLGENGFATSDVALRIGSGDRVTRFDAARLDGRIGGNGVVAGTFTGASGQIGNVPLLLSNGAGDWRFAGGALTLSGGVHVADAAEVPRFEPMQSDDVQLTLRDNRIAAAGTLTTPGGAKVADVSLGHDLSAGSGDAVLDVAGITFTPGSLQPDQLTKLTYGVIAEVNGTLAGRGTIHWDPQGVTSGGSFRTAGIDLAAAFGPVTGIAGEVRFSDLLGLTTPPTQVARVGIINPGIPVENGVIRYRLLGGAKIAVEEGRWPFAGGELVLEPTVLDFGSPQERRMTFRVNGADAAQFLQQMAFENLDATGVFDGVLPMIFDANGGRIEGGRLTARAGGSVAYVGEVSRHDLGTWGNIAFDALKALNYRNLTVAMNGPLAGEMITEIRFAGVSQGAGTKSNFLIRRLQKLPFVFNVTVKAPFRQLIDSVQSYYDPSRLIERNLPALMEQQGKTEQSVIQAPESRPVP